jgi:hypothetical protein
MVRNDTGVFTVVEVVNKDVSNSNVRMHIWDGSTMVAVTFHYWDGTSMHAVVLHYWNGTVFS